MTRKRKQEGHIFKASGFWYVRYRDTRVVRGEIKRLRIAKKLAPVAGKYRSKANVQSLADDLLRPLNEGRFEPEMAVTMGDFVSSVYLPYVKAQRRPSTAKGYRDIWDNHLKARCSAEWLRDVRTCNVQGWLNDIARCADLTRGTMRHIKALLSGLFSYAKRQGYLDAVNPAQGTEIPHCRQGEETYAYSLEEIEQMLAVLPEPAATLVAAAAFTGVRRGELRGLSWENYHDGEILVAQSVWKKHVSEPKTVSSKAPVPIIPTLSKRLELHRERGGNPQAGYIFSTGSGTSLCPNNVLTRQITPALVRCAVCKKARGSHTRADHPFKLDETMPKWRGWHAFRRGLATNLHRIGIADIIIQRILRHSNVSMTQKAYIKTSSPESVAAMERLSEVMANKRPIEVPHHPTRMVN